MTRSGRKEGSLVPSKGNVSSVLANLGLVLNIANNGFRTGGEKGFSFPETGFFLRGFSRCYSLPRGGWGIFSFPQTDTGRDFLHLQYIGAGFVNL